MFMRLCSLPTIPKGESFYKRIEHAVTADLSNSHIISLSPFQMSTKVWQMDLPALTQARCARAMTRGRTESISRQSYLSSL